MIFLRGITKKFGANAGKVWTTLEINGPLTFSNLLKNTKLSLNDLYVAIGWLARENKICKNGFYYQLGETNLTNLVGDNAGKVWRVLNSQGEASISSISKLTQIKIQDAYSAVGWLAREDKIKGEKTNKNQFLLKLR